MGCFKCKYKFKKYSVSCLKMALHQQIRSFKYQVLQIELGERELGYDHYFCTIILSLLCLVLPLYHEAGRSHLRQNCSSSPSQDLSAIPK